MNIFDNITEIFSWIFLVYGILVCTCYVLAAIFSFYEIRDYKRKYNLKDEVALLQSNNLPAISILAPAYNEEANIVENVRSLLTVNYPYFEIVIINDGSKDGTLNQLISTFQLIEDDTPYHNFIPSKDINRVYRSSSHSFRNLKVIDKKNGGKADALNAGINACSHEIICCIDVDCILESDALLKLIKPFLNNKNKVIASGGIIRIANSCIIEDGRIIEVKLPEKFIAKAQVIEYFRAFLMGRMAWSRIDGLMLISGAFGMFDKQTVMDAGGYNHNTVGEDMELLVRMRRVMAEKNTPYTVGFIPDPLCWTEVPQDWNILYRQRNRWTRGTIETLWLHRKMMFNPKYKILGLLSAPYWMLFEWLAPIIEFCGILFFMLLLLFGKVNWFYVSSFFLASYSFIVLFSITAIFFEEYSFQQYKRTNYIYKLILTACLEPFILHPYIVWSSLKGNIDLIRGKKSWGEMQRTGLRNSAKT
ncbi:glycosyltransferase family 2 protein [Robertkochia solimangrovi]|uniref:glycosyltransferase family 2 protein n=1 Tax=Robertkochia solimangrovi TaxID=2213046 RepID=UPI00117D5A13|nr:glycosyltransferase [Robertkochia solimangrovi]TRZ44339.1 glycosyltransferase family 2 protein [Robertkochia solimangrovi]